MKKFTKAARKVVVALIGFPLLAVGIVLIPLPGPGLLVCFLGLLVLSLEFDWAERHLTTIKNQLRAIIQKAKPKD